ncbi:MAG TPA: peptide chain release factor N(5)-glutamine methyltransferase [Candidatus Saccharimonadales bacterium]|nr:peptide chain release factor N(5)-glutamine methyltransferase [Candidatus Saccharimonadales bacterium]
MNVSLPQKTPTYRAWVQEAAKKLSAEGISSARLDAEIILAHTIRKNRTYVHAHNDERLDIRQLEIADARLTLRLERTPIAYIIGHKEFYGRSFKVTPATLIPRPESETIITLLKEIVENQPPSLLATPQRLIDIGTGSGCLGITAKLELPTLRVTLADISNHALKVAESNAQALGGDVDILHSDLLESYPFSPHYIIANLPYVDHSWELSPETQYEPELALFASDNGLQLINKLVEEASTRLASNGYLFLEADPRQHQAIVMSAKDHHFSVHATDGFIIVLQKT